MKERDSAVPNKKSLSHFIAETEAGEIPGHLTFLFFRSCAYSRSFQCDNISWAEKFRLCWGKNERLNIAIVYK